MSYMDDVQYNKLIQPEFSCDSHRKERKKGKSAEPARMSKESVPLVMDISFGPAYITDDDDDFVNHPQ